MTTPYDWSAPTTPDEVARRAAGRSRYNARRTEQARLRRREVARRVLADGWGWGAQRRIADDLGVSEATISRDLKMVWAEL